MIFLTTDFDYRCAKLGTIFTIERKLTEEEIAQLSDKTLSRKSKVEIATAFIKKFTGKHKNLSVNAAGTCYFCSIKYYRQTFIPFRKQGKRRYDEFAGLAA